MNKFRVQLFGTLSAIIFMIVVLFATMNYISFKRESVALNKSILQTQNAEISAELTTRVSGYLKMLSSIDVTNRDIANDRLSERGLNQLNALIRSQKSITDGIAILNKKGELFGGPTGAKFGFNAKELKRPFYTELFQGGNKSYISKPFKSKLTSNEVIAMSYKINENFAVVSTVLLSAVLEEHSERKGMYLYTSDGTILHAPNPKDIEKNLFELRPYYKGLNESNRELSYSTFSPVLDREVNLTGFWGELDITNWQFVVLTEDDSIYAAAEQQLLLSLLLGFISLVVAMGVLYVMIKRLVLEPVGGTPSEIAELLEEMAKGDLSRNITRKGDETGIYQSFVDLSHQLTSLIKTSYGISENVSTASTQLNSVMENTQANAKSELEQIEQITSSLRELNSASQEVSEKAVVAEDAAKRAQENVASGNQTLDKNIDLTNRINASFAETAHIVDELRQFALEIGSVTEVISGISEQTNLLALNAAIEAARAGEQGRGFAVVADEVRNLASKTQESTVNIQEIIEKLQSQSERANNNMGNNVELIKSSVSLATQVKDSFEDISQAVQSISDVNTLVAAASHQQLSVTEDIGRITTQTFDSVSENMTSINETLQASRDLSELAESQKNSLSYFKLKRAVFEY
ncbi:methyl-accepting chemotaxis protein [Marinomonas balearica]|uniref:Methyl-accepting chemotaxis protein n=1 Tax=Marinomonas balearica TaxID=491947 RepID=A0A4R6M798_9GAMM|nr:methyl-accepting chemotaxis protein [Marinomonas balearica]TDO97194.1 methyl-accepting chemotaxis protein [Marinomonas balearica]